MYGRSTRPFGKQGVIRVSLADGWQLFRSVRKRQEGQTMTEYAIVLSLVAVVVIAAVAALGSRVSAVLNLVKTKF
jgi:Flp pilus assembly pilin Flp